MKPGIHRFRIRCLSPVHVGTGEEYPALWIQGGARVDDRALFASRPDRAEKLADLVEQASRDAGPGRERAEQALRRELQEAVPLPELYRLGLSGPLPGRPLQAVRAFLRDASQNPYLPGTSVKGAVRTALASHALSSDGRRRSALPETWESDRGQRKDKEVMKDIFGKEAQKDILRLLAVRDSSPFPRDAVAVGEVAVATRARNPSVRTLAEFLRTGAEAEMEWIVGNDFYRNRARAEELDWLGRLPLLDRLEEAVREHARRVAQADRRFAQGAGLGSLVRFCEQIEGRLAKGGATLILRLGAGSGRRGTTVLNAYPEDKWRGRVPLADYPRSRKLVRVDGEWWPLGWVELTEEGSART